jgi:hypothetical protein
MSRSAEFASQSSSTGAEPFGLRPLSAIAATGAGGVPQARIRQLLADLIEPLSALHAWGRVHGGISTETIGRGESGPAQLLDPAGEPVPNGENAVRRPGFAAFEQYTDDPNSPCGPWTDIYALSAVAYSLVNGSPPRDALARRIRDDYIPLARRAPQGYDPSFLSGVDAGLSMAPSARPQTLEAYAVLLNLPVAAPAAPVPAVVAPAASEPVPVSAPSAAAATPPPARREKPRNRVSGLSVLMVVVVVALAAFLWLRGRDTPPDVVARSGSTPAPASGGASNGGTNFAPAPAAGQGGSAPAAAPAGSPAAGTPAGGASGAGSPAAGSSAAGSSSAGSSAAGSSAPGAPAAGPSAAGSPGSGSPGSTNNPAAIPGGSSSPVYPSAGAGDASQQGASAAAGGAAAGLPEAPQAHESIISTVTLGGAAPIRSRAGVPEAGQSAGQTGAQAAMRNTDQIAGQPGATPAAAAAPAKPRSGPVAVKVDVRPWGEVIVDGKSRGISPPLRELKLPPGKHSVTVQNAGLPPYSATLDIKEGQAAAISHVFQ